MGNSHSLKPIDSVLNGNTGHSRYLHTMLGVPSSMLSVCDNEILCYDYDGLQRARVYVSFVDYGMQELPLSSVVDALQHGSDKRYRLKPSMVVMGSCFKYDLEEHHVYHRQIVVVDAGHDVLSATDNRRFARSFDRIKALKFDAPPE